MSEEQVMAAAAEGCVECLPPNPVEQFLRSERMPHIWCPGCGIGTTVNCFARALIECGTDLDKLAVVSGIGCSSRFPYYMNTYGIHSIHGRAPAVATGLKASRPDLSVWVITGDGDVVIEIDREPSYIFEEVVQDD